MRPLYDHYRKIKRILAKFTGTVNLTPKSNNDTNNEENEEEENGYQNHKTFYNLHSLNL
jgi:hypothetical protein